MTETFLGAWQIDDDFPHTGSDDDRLAFAARFARLAPSGHNGQPWTFEVSDGELAVCADPARALPTIDPDDRELTLTCAASARFAALALDHFGYPPLVDTAADPARPTVIARIRVGARREPPDDRAMFDAITARHCNRHPYRDTAVPQHVLTALADAAGVHGCWVAAVTAGEQIARCADLIAQGDRVKWREREFRHELAERLVPNRGARRDGMPGYAFGVPGPLARWAPAAVRRADLGPVRAFTDRRLARATPALLVLGTDHDDRAAWVSAGLAMADVLLHATSAGLATGFLSQAIEVPALRPRLIPVLGREGFPQVLLRVGYARRSPRPSPRRELHDVLVRSQTIRKAVS